MKAKEIKTWKQFWNTYFEDDNATLTLETFKDLRSYTDPIENAETGDWLSAEEIFELYESDELIQVHIDEDDGINVNDFIIVIYSPQWKYIVPTTPDFVEDYFK